MSRSQNLMEPLQQVTAQYGSAAAPTGRTAAGAPDRGAEGLDALVGLSLEQPGATRKLNEAVSALRDAPQVAAALNRILEGAMALVPCEFANVQIVDPRDRSLVLVAQSGFGTAFLDHFAVVRDGRSVCGEAARLSLQTVVADVRTEPVLEPHWGVFRDAGIRSVQSTPLVDGTGRLVGILSTHASQPLRPSDRDMLVMRLYSRFAGQALARLLDGASPDDAGTGAAASAPVSPATAQFDSTGLRVDSPARRLMTETVSRLHAAGLSLAEAERLISERLPAERLRTGVEEIDGAIRAIQSAVLDRTLEDPVVGRGHHTQGTPR